MIISRSRARRVQRRVLGYILRVAEHIVSTARSRRVSVKLKTLVKYGYAAYAYGTLDFRRVRGLTSRVRVPGRLANQYFYRKVEEELARNFDVEFEDRRGFRYAVFRARLGAPLPQHLQPGVVDGEARQ